MILGQWFVRKQQPEYVGAPQKRFAWAIGFVMASSMLYLVVINNIIGPINLIICSACLLLLFFEASFGICIGCKIYNVFNKDKAQLCPGGVCEISTHPVGRQGAVKFIILFLFVAFIGVVVNLVISRDSDKAQPAQLINSQTPSVDSSEAERCTVPDFAKKLGHEEKWKLHNNCK
jgi:hypothetical protein